MAALTSDVGPVTVASRGCSAEPYSWPTSRKGGLHGWIFWCRFSFYFSLCLCVQLLQPSYVKFQPLPCLADARLPLPPLAHNLVVDLSLTMQVNIDEWNFYSKEFDVGQDAMDTFRINAKWRSRVRKRHLGLLSE